MRDILTASLLLVLSLFSCSTAEPPALEVMEGTWQLIKISPPDELPGFVNGAILLEVKADQQIGIQLSGCNVCGLDYTIEPANRISLSVPFCTSVGCDTPLDELFLDILISVDQYVLLPDLLTLRGAEGTLVLNRLES